jgi:hypothetical protein
VGFYGAEPPADCTSGPLPATPPGAYPAHHALPACASNGSVLVAVPEHLAWPDCSSTYAATWYLWLHLDGALFTSVSGAGGGSDLRAALLLRCPSASPRPAWDHPSNERGLNGACTGCTQAPGLMRTPYVQYHPPDLIIT